MKRLTLFAIFVLALSSVVWAQDKSAGLQKPKCTLTLTQAPELRGFRLGMEQQRVLARFPGLSLDRADKFGHTKVSLIVMDHEDYPGGSVGRDRGVQKDIAVTSPEGQSFFVDSSRFPNLKGVKRIRLRFIDGRISYLQVGYDDSLRWNDVNEFVQVISTPLKLDGAWQRSEAEDPKEKELPCDGFLVTASLGGSAGESHIGTLISLEDMVATGVIEKRQNDQKEKARRQEEERRKLFKP